MAAGRHLRSGLVLCALVVAVAALVLATPTAVRPAESDDGPRTREDVQLVAVEGYEPRLWAYTSRDRDFATATLPMNVVVEQDAATTRRVIAAAAGGNWTVDDPEGKAVVVNGSGVAWTDTHGATRYTYVEDGGRGRWMDETAQIHDGAYLGARVHARLYEVQDGDRPLTVVQAHQEHWDWFRLRHTVGSVARGQHAVEHEFYGTGLVADVRRDRFGNGGASDADGWVTVVDLLDRKLGGRAGAGGIAAGVSLGLLLVGARRATLAATLRAFLRRRQATAAHAALVGLTLLTPLAVRVAAVGLERAVPALSPKVIAAPCYLALAVGLPAGAGLLGRYLPADEAFAAAAVGFGTGLLLDYAYLGITLPGVGVVAHRAVLVFGLGLIAAGGVRWARRPVHRNRYRAPGVLVWAGALLWPLAGL